MEDEPFTLVVENEDYRGLKDDNGRSNSTAVAQQPQALFPRYAELLSARTADHDIQHLDSLRNTHRGMIVTCVPELSAPLRAFAAAGQASCVLDTENESIASMRGYVESSVRDQPGLIGESVQFAKYRFAWGGEFFIFYLIEQMQYVIKEARRDEGETTVGPSKATDALILAVGEWFASVEEVVWVYDNYWRQSAELYEQVRAAGWDKVILDEKMKKDLTSAANNFFDSKAVYDDLGVPWKRGLLFHGPPGNGKTISIRALMHSLLFERKSSIPTLYVKAAPSTYDIGQVFARARTLAPCMLILEDVETIVTPDTRSYFFNEMDGLANNGGLFVVASTNFLDRLDPGLSKRPSRFDRKYLFPLPSDHERALYCDFWRRKLRNNPAIEFPAKLSPAMARITPGFSFAFLQECFVATLLILARGHDDDDDDDNSPEDVAGGENEDGPRHAAPGGADGNDDDEDDDDDDDNDDDLNHYELWVTFKQQADILRKEIKDDHDHAYLSHRQQQQQQQQQQVGGGDHQQQHHRPPNPRPAGRVHRNPKTTTTHSLAPVRASSASASMPAPPFPAVAAAAGESLPPQSSRRVGGGGTGESGSTPSLPYYVQKSQVFTETAFETRL